jgi:hypothetical protein
MDFRIADYMTIHAKYSKRDLQGAVHNYFYKTKIHHMSNPLKLEAGKQYRLIKPFTDYDQNIHPVGETWVFSRTAFLPYEDGLTLHVFLPGDPKEKICRLQWRREQQADIIEQFSDYVTEA